MNLIKYIKQSYHNRWNLAFFDYKKYNAKEFPTLHWMKNAPSDRWFADPFILDVTESQIVFLAEEFCYDIHRGRIAKIVVNKVDYSFAGYKILLDLDTHLSFPFTWRREDGIYVLPENSASGKSTLYKLSGDYESLTKVKVICEQPLTDAIIVNLGGEKTYLLSTQVPDMNRNKLDIREFDVNSLSCSGIIRTVEFDNNIARNAGAVFCKNGKLFRPAQDCDKCYGHGIVVQEVNLTGEKVIDSFENVAKYYPVTFTEQRGLHTLNAYKGIGVIDAYGYKSPVLGRLMFNIVKFVKLVLGK